MNQIINLDRPDEEMIIELLVGEYMKITVDMLKATKTPWHELKEDVQATKLAILQEEASKTIARMVSMTASIKHDVLQANLLDVKKGKKEITAKLEFALNDDKQFSLYEYANRRVMLVLADPTDYIVDGDLPQADLDQPPLNGFQ